MMTKRLFFPLGVIAGLLFAGIAIRKKMERLKVLEANDALHKEINAAANARWQQELERMPFEKRMDYELFEASLKMSNYQPDWDEDDDHDDV